MTTESAPRTASTFHPLSEDRSAEPAPLVTVRVDGREVTAREGRPLVEALTADPQVTGAQGEESFPAVCYLRSLGPIQTCDTCMVEIDGQVVRACATPVTEDLVVATTGAAARAREEAGQRLVRKHILYCTICDNNNGDCTLKQGVEATGVEHERIGYKAKPHDIDESNPFYRYDPGQCILCGRCVEACQTVQVTETLSIDWEAENPRVLWDGGKPIGESSCVSCGHCVTVCPCNALMEKSMLGRAGLFTGWPDETRSPAIDIVKDIEPTTGYLPLYALSKLESTARGAASKVTKTVCTYCGVGCSFDVMTRGREILKIQPREEGPANAISTCVKGKFGWDHINAVDRLTTPLVRDGDRFRQASWDEALDLVAARFRQVLTEHGPDACAVIGSSKATNEESYLTQKFARQVLGTHNTDNCSRYCQAPATQGLWRTVGYGGDAGSISDMERAALVLCVGTNTSDSHPVIASRLKRAQKLGGHQIIVADLRRHDLARRADVFIRPNPGSDLVWLSAVTKHIIDSGWADADFIRDKVNGWDDYVASLAPFTLEYAEQRTSIPVDQLKDVARRIAEAESVVGLWAMGVTQHHMGSDTSTAISNLLLVTGNYGRPGTGGYPLRGHNNVQGCSDFGTINSYYPGYQSVADEDARQRFAEAWQMAPMTTEKGLDNHGMVDEIHAGSVHAMLVVGEELSLVDANAHYVQEALEKLDFLVVSELFFSRTCEYADVVLPAAASLEKDGTFVNTERRIQRLYEAMPPIGEARPDWRILTDLAARMGRDWGYTHPSQIMAECAGLTPLFAGVSYERLEGYASLQWPVAPDGTDSPLLYTDGFHFEDGRAKLHPLQFREPSDQTDEEYPLHVNNGRVLEHFHEGNMTLRSKGLSERVPDTYVEISRRTAEDYRVATGDWVELESRRGSITVRALLSDQVRDGELWVPMQCGEINVLTSNVTDPDSHTPAYKEVAVRLRKVDGAKERRGGSRRGPDRGRRGARDAEGFPTGPPLPATYHRYGHPTPQPGVEVGRKWARDDYAPPTEPEPPNAKA